MTFTRTHFQTYYFLFRRFLSRFFVFYWFFWFTERNIKISLTLDRFNDLKIKIEFYNYI